MLRRKPSSTVSDISRSAKPLGLAVSALLVLASAGAAAAAEIETLESHWIESTLELVDAEIVAARLDTAARIAEAAGRAFPSAARSPVIHAKLVLAEARIAFYREFLPSSFSDHLLDELRSALTTVQAANDNSTRAAAQDLLDFALFLHDFRASEHAEARALFDTALETRRGLRDRRGVAETLFHLGLTHEHRQDPGPADREKARRLYEESLRVAEAGGFDYEASYPVRHLAGLRDEAGDLEGARAGFERSLELRRRTGATLVLGPALTALADVVVKMGDVERARELYEEALTTARAVGATGVEGAAREGLARLPTAASQTTEMAADGALLALPTFADSRTEAIEEAVVRGYVDGIWREAREELVRSGFHPSFVMHALRDGEVTNVSLDAWLERLDLTGEGNPRIRHELEILSHTGSAAAARVEIYEGERHLYTDYLSLYRFDDGWKIVSKIFYPHD